MNDPLKSFPLARQMRVCASVSLGAVLLGFAPAAPAPAQAPAPVKAAPAGNAPKTPPQAFASGATQAANGAEPGQPTAPKPEAAISFSVLPAPLPPSLTQGINVDARSSELLAHLSEVLRFDRMMATPIQKVGEPSDILYAEQAQAEATQAAQLAFQAARDEAALLARVPGKGGVPSNRTAPQGESQKLNTAQVTAAQRIASLQQQSDMLDAQIASAPASKRTALQQQQETIRGQLELNKAMANALGKVAGISAAESSSGLQGDINRLQHSAPELVDNKVKPVTSTIESLAPARDAGLSSQATVLFQLLGTDRALDQRIQEEQKLHDQALDLRTPLVKILRATLQAGQVMQDGPATDATTPGAGAPAGSPAAPADPEATKKRYDELTDAFNAISNVSIPISQEVLLLEQTRSNLVSWRTALDAERGTVVRALLFRVFFIALALAILLGINEVARRSITKYVQDIRRRRQFLVIRRALVTFLSGLVLLFGFVTQFTSLATFAGFITAGIAVGLQTILLSVAAYFFIVGRYGVRVGDRITIAGVTGDVVDVGLIRFYMMELTGTGTELHPTGRIAVFANSILFQAGTPLYKQMPGTDYAWHELVIKLKPDVAYQAATDAVLTAVTAVYTQYKARIEQQHHAVETWMDAALESPHIESRLQLGDGLQYAVLYPVEMREAASTDEKVVQSVLELMNHNADVKSAIDGSPAVKAVIKS